MNKEQQDLAWSVLPKEFKEEVKYEYHRVATKVLKTNYDLGFMNVHEGMFGIHNLASDAEGEEMLTVSRKRVQEMYALNEDILFLDQTHCGAILLKKKLTDLFGSKCLPDEEQIAENANCSNVDSSEPNVDSLPQNPTENCDNKSHISADCNKPAEPMYKRGDNVMYDGTVQTIVSENVRCGREYYLSGVEYPVAESDLEPYTEPSNEESAVLRAESVKESRIASEKSYLRNLSQETANCDKEFDNILKDSFSKKHRLQIAAMAMAGILSKGELADPDEVTDMALIYADELIGKCEEGGTL